MLRCEMASGGIAARLILAASLLFGCGDDSDGPAGPGTVRPHYTYSVPEVVAGDWEVAHSDSVGILSTRLEDYVDTAVAGYMPQLHSTLIVRDGRLVFEEYFSGWHRDSLHTIMSCTKSVTSGLIGAAIDRELLTDIDRPIFDFFPQYDSLRTPAKDSILLRHVMSMSAGLEWDQWSYPYTDPRNSLLQMWQYETYWAHFVLSRERIYVPGTFFAYSDGLANLTGQVVQFVTGSEAQIWAEDVLFGPLGITDYRWEGDWRSFPNTGYGLYLRPRDMAKFGQLYLRRGMWGDQRVLSADWVDLSTEQKIVVHAGTWEVAYGLYWWTVILNVEGHPVPAYFASGDFGQEIFVIESLDMVVVFTMGRPEGEGYVEARNALSNYILPAAL